MSLFDGFKEFRAARLSNKATTAMMNGDPETAEDLYRKSLALMEAGNRGSLQTAFHVAGLAGALEAQGRWEECLPLAKRAIIMVESIAGHDAEVAGVMTSMLRPHLYQQTFNDTKPVLHRVTTALERIVDPAIVAPATREIADDLRLPVFRDHTTPDGDERLAEAEVLYRRSLDLHGTIPEPDPTEQFLALDGLGSTLMLAGRLDEAEDIHRATLRQMESTFDTNHTLYGRAHASLADVLFRREDFAAAVESFKQALSLWEQELGLRTHPELLGLVKRIALTLRQLGRADEAEVYESRADAIREVMQESEP